MDTIDLKDFQEKAKEFDGIDLLDALEGNRDEEVDPFVVDVDGNALRVDADFGAVENEESVDDDEIDDDVVDKKDRTRRHGGLEKIKKKKDSLEKVSRQLIEENLSLKNKINKASELLYQSEINQLESARKELDHLLAKEKIALRVSIKSGDAEFQADQTDRISRINQSIGALESELDRLKGGGPYVLYNQDDDGFHRVIAEMEEDDDDESDDEEELSPDQKKWVKKNSWFGKDDSLTAIAEEVGQKLTLRYKFNGNEDLIGSKVFLDDLDSAMSEIIGGGSVSSGKKTSFRGLPVSRSHSSPSSSEKSAHPLLSEWADKLNFFNPDGSKMSREQKAVYLAKMQNKK